MKFLLAVMFLVAAPAAQGAEQVSTKTNPSTGHAYVLIRGDDPKRGISWADANEYAKSLGGHLVVINDEAERQWLIESFPAMQDRLDAYYWIGLADSEEEGTFKWVNGDPVEFTAWHAGFEPNNAGTGEDYVHVYNFPGGAFQWNDLPNEPTFKPKEGNYPISAIVELPAGQSSTDNHLADDPFAGVYRGLDGKGNPIVAIALGDEKYELQSRNWSGSGFWDRINQRYIGVYRHPGPAPAPAKDPNGVVGYHRMEPVGDGVFAVIAVGDVGPHPLPPPFMIKRDGSQPSLNAAKKSSGEESQAEPPARDAGAETPTIAPRSDSVPGRVR